MQFIIFEESKYFILLVSFFSWKGKHNGENFIGTYIVLELTRHQQKTRIYKISQLQTFLVNYFQTQGQSDISVSRYIWMIPIPIYGTGEPYIGIGICIGYFGYQLYRYRPNIGEMYMSIYLLTYPLSAKYWYWYRLIYRYRYRQKYRLGEYIGISIGWTHISPTLFRQDLYQ